MLERLLTVAQTPEERWRAFAIAERHQQNLIVQEILAEVKAKSWGDRVSPALRAEIVRWALDHGADPVDEVDVLGGAPWLNARFWQRMVRGEPDFLRAEEVWVHDDPRATEEVRAERRALRVQYAVPDTIDGNLGIKQADRKKDPTPVPVRAAVLLWLYFDGRGPFLGKKHSPSRANDDVGLDFPEPTALTRAWRKAALQAVRRETPLTARLRDLAAQQRVFSKVPPGPGEEQLGAIIEGMPAEPLQIKAGTQARPVSTEEAADLSEQAVVTVSESAQPTMTRHSPNLICPTAGEHEWANCGHNKPQPPKAAA